MIRAECVLSNSEPESVDFGLFDLLTKCLPEFPVAFK